VQGKILVVDAIATNRIMLKVKLGTAFYTVLQASSLTEALDVARDKLPNLVISALSLPDGHVGDLCTLLREMPVTAHIPVMAISAFARQQERLEALEAGVQDVLYRPVDETLLLSRVRNMIRAHTTEFDLQMRDDTSRALGLAEDGADFAGQAHCALVSGDKTQLSGFALQLRAVLDVKLTVATTSDLLAHVQVDALPDAYVLALPSDPTAAQEDLHLLSALKASPKTRHAGILVLQTTPNPALAAHALDLGADDLMPDGFDATELALRLNAVIRRKRVAARLRATVRTGLKAAVLDPLTGLHNRRYAMPHLDRIADHARGTGRPFAVLVADLDHFKQVNDLYGHASGDAVLVEVADRLRHALRSSDMVARIGGEEFMIVMPGTSHAEAQKVALRICEEIYAQPFSVPGHATPIRITTSIGMAVSDAEGADASTQTAASMLDRADKALYAAKGKGRNRVTLDRPAA
jgi:two-component system cell cycle response regulator